MYKILFPISDTTIYERFPYKNVGTDAVIELTKASMGAPSLYTVEEDGTYQTYEGTYNSRILMKFDLIDLMNNQTYLSASYYLNIRATEATELPIQYTLYAHPISGSWENGTGFYNNEPEITNGASWKYRSGKLSAIVWPTSSLASTVTASYSNEVGGGNWFTSSFATQSFNYQEPDVRMDVTSIVRSWLIGSITNDGLILKFSETDEKSNSILGSIKFFSKDTHTIYVPRLEVFWNAIDHSGTGSINQVSDDDFVLYLKNLKDSFNENEVSKIKVGVRERYPVQTYVTSSNYLTTKRPPSNTYFQIMDNVTDEVFVPFHNPGTKVNCDVNGAYIKMDCYSLMPERYYKLVFKSEFDDGIVRYVDENFIFKINR